MIHLAGLVVSAWPQVAIQFSWPTAEMASRGTDWNLIVGAFFAVPSGAIVALTTSQGGNNAIVGVAISASILPPSAYFRLLVFLC